LWIFNFDSKTIKWICYLAYLQVDDSNIYSVLKSNDRQIDNKYKTCNCTSKTNILNFHLESEIKTYFILNAFLKMYNSLKSVSY